MAPFFSGRCSHLSFFLFFLRSLAAFLCWAGSVLKETLLARSNSKLLPNWLRCWCRYEITLLFVFGIYAPFLRATCTKKCLLFVREKSSKAVKGIQWKYIRSKEKALTFWWGSSFRMDFDLPCSKDQSQGALFDHKATYYVMQTSVTPVYTYILYTLGISLYIRKWAAWRRSDLSRAFLLVFLTQSWQEVDFFSES